MSTHIRKQLLLGSAGAIEVAAEEPHLEVGQSAMGTAFIAHPHPLFGGTMDNKVVQTLARAFVLRGWQAVRFNFRGVGASAGAFDEGRGELADFLSVVHEFEPQGAIALAGFSFGAFVASRALEVLCATRKVSAIVLVGTAVSRFQVAPIAVELHERTLVVHGEHDDTVPIADVMHWARPACLPVTVVPATGHFFHGQLPLLRGLVTRHLQACPALT